MVDDRKALKARREAAARFGVSAGQVLTNEAYQTAMAKLKADVVQALIETPVTDTDQRERLHSILVAHTRIERMLNKWFADGKIAAEDIIRLTNEGIK